jgi:hypothetical protein
MFKQLFLICIFRMAYESHLHSAFWQKNQPSIDGAAGKHEQKEDEDFDEDCDVEHSDPDDQDDDEEISVT